jgi:hypothetical protein
MSPENTTHAGNARRLGSYLPIVSGGRNITCQLIPLVGVLLTNYFR